MRVVCLMHRVDVQFEEKRGASAWLELLEVGEEVVDGS
jgi:hypothetical protein